MNEDILNNEIIVELKELLEKAEKLEEDKDAYCNLMKTMILNTYSEN